MECVICVNICYIKYELCCGHTYCFKCIKIHTIEYEKDECPICRTRIKLCDKYLLKNIKKWIKMKKKKEENKDKFVRKEIFFDLKNENKKYFK